ncbi:hypothetical protein ABIA39_000277 [Nocardia sp. GAS34]|uniref:hypothetical protein n=1 Tax=unclassified Nocardia TaxID=2637762 RepID=UPI003D1FD890
MYERLTARLDESYTVLGTANRVTRIREHVFTVVPPERCAHTTGRTICARCAGDRQIDYQFPDPFPFPRITDRWTISDLVATGALHVGAQLEMTGTDTTAVVTGTGGLMLSDGRVFENPSAAANAVLGT